jgi:hypothetical protein
MKNEKKDNSETLKKKAYVKPTVAKHTAASLVVGSSMCGNYVGNSSCPEGYYTGPTYFH